MKGGVYRMLTNKRGVGGYDAAYNFCFGVHSRAFRRAGENSSACGKKILGGIGEPSAF